MEEKIQSILGKINLFPRKATAKDLNMAAKYYYGKYQEADSERNKSIYIGQAAYHGAWSVKKGNRNTNGYKALYSIPRN